jgi:hypothetical protein
MDTRKALTDLRAEIGRRLISIESGAPASMRDALTALRVDLTGRIRRVEDEPRPATEALINEFYPVTPPAHDGYVPRKRPR